MRALVAKREKLGVSDIFYFSNCDPAHLKHMMMMSYDKYGTVNVEVWDWQISDLPNLRFANLRFQEKVNRDLRFANLRFDRSQL